MYRAEIGLKELKAAKQHSKNLKILLTNEKKTCGKNEY
jgi:hypothetical protein